MMKSESEMGQHDGPLDLGFPDDDDEPRPEGPSSSGQMTAAANGKSLSSSFTFNLILFYQ